MYNLVLVNIAPADVLVQESKVISIHNTDLRFIVQDQFDKIWLQNRVKIQRIISNIHF